MYFSFSVILSFLAIFQFLQCAFLIFHVSVEIELKYEGYIRRQQADIEEARRLEGKKLPAGLDYSQVLGLRLEAVEKLNQVKPENLSQAGRVSGVSPADISVLMIWLAAQEKKQKEEAH